MIMIVWAIKTTVKMTMMTTDNLMTAKTISNCVTTSTPSIHVTHEHSGGE